MSGDAASNLPHPQAGDSEDVAWALETAASLWKRGEHADAIAWIRKAANAAADADADLRVIELAKAAAELKALSESFASAPAQPPAPRLASERAPDGSFVDIELEAPTDAEAEAETELDLEPEPEPEPARPPPPPRPKGPPPRRLPTPNPVPSPFRHLPFDEIRSAALMEETSEAPPEPEPIPPSHDGDSLRHIPSVPPAPPDFSPTPMAMPVAKSIPPPFEPPPPQVAIAPEEPRARRISTAPFGTPDAETFRRMGAPESSRPASDPEVVTSAPPIPRPRLRTPPMGSVPPPRPSLPASAAGPVSEEGVQSHVSDAPPRGANASAVQIPAAPRAPSIAAPRRVSIQPPRGADALDPELLDALGDMPDEVREALETAAEKRALAPGEVVRAPAMVLVTHGELDVRAIGFASRLDTIGDGQVRVLSPFSPAEGDLELVGGAEGARYLAFSFEAVEHLRTAAPWVMSELEPLSDDVHVVAGCLRGSIGVRLDGQVLDALLVRAKTMRLAPNAKVVKQGEAVRALILVGAGELEIRAEGDANAPVLETLDPGDVVFASELLARQSAPATVRAGERGALVIVATRAATEELLVTVPPLLDILGGA